ncbi:alcohol dehydrogenase [Candidatus Bathyarchaeota archaeon]|nr:MAG: alcohol dehydrogenase [Candidatus Bathyarchaeota archaeon]RLI12277.1 MAG: alcohol dehydrogenase [Candidatus Bathyarchaeota archaeon]RLI22258.1 MAG: alcohol dehydrogenase [Candidatus Bathyarchaeota archaeon]
MKAAMLYGVKDLRIEDVEIPKVGLGEVLVKVKAATTCGTDLKIFRRGYVEKVIKLPTVFGHEWAGEVVEVGEGLEWPKKGMRIRAGNSAPCLHCTMCQKGKYNLCENMIWLWGAYAEYIKVPARMVLVNMQEIPQHVSYEEAAITEPLACVLHGAEEANIKPGDTVTIIGAGPIGLLHLLTAKKFGAGRVISIDLVEDRLNFAERLGADETVNAGKEDVVERVRELTGGYGSDVVIEAIGLPSTWEQALKLVRKGGTVLEFGGCPPGTEIKVNTEKLHYGELTVRGSFHATPLHFRKALNLIASRTIDVRPLITRKMRLENIREAFDILMTSKKEIKIAIIP